MLRGLEIRDMLIIERLDLAFRPGLNVLTGETGAGKSILLDSLGFVLGWRGRAELVRKGADRGEVTAVFDLPPGHPAHAILAEAGIEPNEDDPGELILRRVNYQDGRKTAWINDRRASGETLRALSDTLVELHGQQDDKGPPEPAGAPDSAGRLLGRRGVAGAGCARPGAGGARRARTLAEAEARRNKLKQEEDFLRTRWPSCRSCRPSRGRRRRSTPAPADAGGGEDPRRDRQGARRDLLARAEGLVAEAMRRLDRASDQAEGGSTSRWRRWSARRRRWARPRGACATSSTR
jgi:DNA repair protein RecN (Recombination protein N)